MFFTIQFHILLSFCKESVQISKFTGGHFPFPVVLFKSFFIISTSLSASESDSSILLSILYIVHCLKRGEVIRMSLGSIVILFSSLASVKRFLIALEFVSWKVTSMFPCLMRSNTSFLRSFTSLFISKSILYKSLVQKRMTYHRPFL